MRLNLRISLQIVIFLLILKNYVAKHFFFKIMSLSQVSLEKV